MKKIKYKPKRLNLAAMRVELMKYFGAIKPIKGRKRKLGSFISR